MLELVRHHVDRLMAFDAVHAPKDRSMVVHVCYYRLVDAPETVMPEVFAALDLAWTPEGEERVRAWRAHTLRKEGAASPTTGSMTTGSIVPARPRRSPSTPSGSSSTSEQVLTRWVIGPVGPSSDGVR